jgi:DNA polymerase-1
MPLLRPQIRPEGRGAQALSTPAKLKKGDHLYLIDGSGYLFRAYHALPPLSRKSDGLPIGAVSGYCNMLWKLLEDMKGWEQPTHLAVVFDKSEVTFRNAIYPQYKAHRPPAPEDLIPQFPLVREATRAFGVSCVEEGGFEADDLIATYTRQAKEAGARVTIVSSDKDLMQLVEDGVVQLLDTMKNKRIGSAEVLERFGVTPDKVVEVQALAGDSVDNVPGVPGIGVKTAAELLGIYGDLETLLARAGEIKQPKRRETLMNNAENARISLKLVTLDANAKISVPVEEFAVREPEPGTLLPFLKVMEFAAITKRVAARFGIENTDDIKPAADPAQGALPSPGSVTPLDATAPVTSAKAIVPTEPGAIAGEDAIRRKIEHDKYETVATAARLDAWIARARETGKVAVDLQTTSLDAMQAKLCGIALCVAPGEACYIPTGHSASDGLNLSDNAKTDQLSEPDVLAKLKPLLEDPSILKIAQNMKYDHLMLQQRGIRIAPFDDTLLIHYVLDGGLRAHGMDELSAEHLNHTPISYQDVTGKGKDKKTFDFVPVKDATRYAAEDADIALRLHAILKPRLAKQGKVAVYETLERPLVPVLCDMEREGIMIDPGLLRRLSNDFAKTQAGLEKEIFKVAGGEINLGSPKQLGDFFFGTLKLPGGRKTKTGAWSTDADVLEEIAAQGHDVATKVLEWRQLSKLRGTYTDALPTYVNPTTGRVHTSFQMAAAATGRLASTDPNLQNIPIRTEEGRRIRQAFIAPDGFKLLSADYSQIELRLFAHIADIPQLKKAFAEELDIHAMTASEMFNVPVKDMPREIRSRAKAINFGIIYGISAFGLSNQLGIARSEADDYIKKYFQRFPGIRDYMETTKQFAREHGYVETLFGRRIHIREIKSSNPGHRGGAERAAINAPIQGSAADVIRRAMVRIPEALKAKKLKARMLLQVHDELVFEVPDKEIDALAKVAKHVMEKAPLPAVQLSVPLTVDARAAENWDAAH